MAERKCQEGKQETPPLNMKSDPPFVGCASPKRPWAIRPWCLTLSLAIAGIIWLEWIAYAILAYRNGVGTWTLLAPIGLWPIYFLIVLGIAYGLAEVDQRGPASRMIAMPDFFRRQMPDFYWHLTDWSFAKAPNVLLLIAQAMPLAISTVILWLALKGNFTVQ